MKIIGWTSEKQLIKLCRLGNTAAQKKVYKKYAQAMYQISRNIIKDDMRAEEAMQDAFLAAFDKLDEFKGESTFGAWLKRIVIHQALDYLKVDKMYAQTESIDHWEKEESVEEIDLTDKINWIKKAMTELPDNYRIILSLFYLEGYDHQEIAEILNLSEMNSRTMLHRAKNQLIRRLK